VLGDQSESSHSQIIASPSIDAAPFGDKQDASRSMIPGPSAPSSGIARYDSVVRMLHWLMGALMLACIHALAALWHHFIRKDATVMRMLPIKR
jgi:cytochrome b561